MNRLVICYIAVSLDGYIARSDGAVDWLDAYTDLDYGYKDFNDSVDTVIMGYRTYEKSLEFGPDTFKGKTYYVMSRSQKSEDWGEVRFTRETPQAICRRLKTQEGAKIWMMGGGILLSAFLAEGLIDELMMFVIPENLGSGIPLFPEGGPQSHWLLSDSVKYPNGVVLLHYHTRVKE